MAHGQTIQVDHFTDARIAEIYAGAPLTIQERAFLIVDTPTFEEAQHLLEKELAKMDDVELMRTAHGVWADYVSCL